MPAEIYSLKIEDAVEYSGISKSELYRLIAANRIEARKAGRITLILGDSLRSYIKSLPAAVMTQRVTPPVSPGA